MVKVDIHKELFASDDIFNLNVNFTVNKGKFVTIYGASGSGKTTLLRMLAGLLTPDAGEIEIGGETWFSSTAKLNTSPQKRKVGFVFQDYALFPNMTVRQNLEFGLEKDQSIQFLDELIEVIELEKLQHRKPNTLSGGQKQRVALARALVQQPEILLLDEPFSAIDDQIRIKLQDYLLKVHQLYGLTTFLVTHEMGEVFKLSDHVIQIDEGKILKQGKPDDLFVSNKLSGKYQFVGNILSISKADVLNIVKVLAGNNVIQVVVTDSELHDFKVGEKVLIASKAFNPILLKIDQ